MRRSPGQIGTGRHAISGERPTELCSHSCDKWQQRKEVRSSECSSHCRWFSVWEIVRNQIYHTPVDGVSQREGISFSVKWIAFKTYSHVHVWRWRHALHDARNMRWHFKFQGHDFWVPCCKSIVNPIYSYYTRVLRAEYNCSTTRMHSVHTTSVASTS